MPNSDSPPEKHNEGRGEFGFGLQMPRFRPKKTKTSVKGELSEKEKSDFVLSHNDPPLSNFDVVKENDNSAIDQIEKQEGQSVKHECTKQEKKKHGFGFKFPKFGFPSFAPPSANHSAVPENGACAAERRPKKNKGGGGFGLKMPKFS